jgi:hypothetical protein
MTAVFEEGAAVAEPAAKAVMLRAANAQAIVFIFIIISLLTGIM